MRAVFALLMSNALAACPFSGMKASSNHFADPFDILQQMDDITTSVYAQNVNQLIDYQLARGIPVIVASDNIDLHIGSTNLTSTPLASVPVHAAYEQFKLCAHPTLTAYSFLQPTISAEPTESGNWLINSTLQRSQMAPYLPLLNTSISQQTWALPSRNLSSVQQQHCQYLLETTYNFLSSVNSTNLLSPQQLRTFTSSVTPHIKALIHDGAHTTLDLTHAAMMHWKQQYLNTTELWESAIAIIPGGSHMARTGQLHMQYFSRLFQVCLGLVITLNCPFSSASDSHP